MNLAKEKFVSVSLYYGNHYQNVMEKFLSNGWAVKSIVGPDYEHGQKSQYITFVAGKGSKEIKLDLPNAHIL